MSLVDALAERGYKWAPLPNQNPAHPLLSAKRTGNFVCVSGQVPIKDGQVVSGKVGGAAGLSLTQARQAAELAALYCLYAAGSVVKPDAIVSIVDVTVYVNCASGFTDTSRVANGASEFLIAVFGDAGKHTRAAIGVAPLPLNAAVEIKMVIEVK